MREPKLIKRCRERHNKESADKNPYTADCIQCGDCRRAYQAELDKYEKFINNRNKKIISLKRISHAQVEQLKNIVIIDYEWWAGKCNQEFYRARYNGEIKDHHTKDKLIHDAEKEGKAWLVIRWHKDRSACATIIQKSKKL